MKHFLFTISLLTSGALAIAADNPLKAVMGDMGALKKQIASQITDSTKNAESADLAAKLRELEYTSIKLTPTKVSDKSSAEARIGQLQYEIAMSNLVELTANLELAFLAGDNAKAQEILKALDEGKSAGHKAFK